MVNKTFLKWELLTPSNFRDRKCVARDVNIPWGTVTFQHTLPIKVKQKTFFFRKNFFFLIFETWFFWLWPIKIALCVTFWGVILEDQNQENHISKIKKKKFFRKRRVFSFYVKTIFKRFWGSKKKSIFFGFLFRGRHFSKNKGFFLLPRYQNSLFFLLPTNHIWVPCKEWYVSFLTVSRKRSKAFSKNIEKKIQQERSFFH